MQQPTRGAARLADRWDLMAEAVGYRDQAHHGAIQCNADDKSYRTWHAVSTVTVAMPRQGHARMLDYSTRPRMSARSTALCMLDVVQWTGRIVPSEGRRTHITSTGQAHAAGCCGAPNCVACRGPSSLFMGCASETRWAGDSVRVASHGLTTMSPWAHFRCTAHTCAVASHLCAFRGVRRREASVPYSKSSKISRASHWVLWPTVRYDWSGMSERHLLKTAKTSDMLLLLLLRCDLRHTDGEGRYRA